MLNFIKASTIVLSLSVFNLQAALATAAESVVGVYTDKISTIEKPGKLVIVQNGHKLEGIYFMNLSTGSAEGRITFAPQTHPRILEGVWKDTSGSGVVKFVFDAKYESFDGRLRFQNVAGEYPWQGIRD